MTNQPPTIKDLEEKYWELWMEEKDLCHLDDNILNLFRSYLSEVLDWLVADLADIGYTVEVLEDYLIDKQNVQAKKHVAHIKGQLTELNAKIAYIVRKK